MTGSEFATRRKTADLTQQQLASLLDVDRVTVARWEAGDETPAMAVLALRTIERDRAAAADETRIEHYVEVARAVYTLAPNPGSGTTLTASVYRMGQTGGAVAIVPEQRYRTVETAQAIAAALSGREPDAVSVTTRYMVFDERPELNPCGPVAPLHPGITPGGWMRRAPRAINRAEFDAYTGRRDVWGERDGAA